MLNRSRLSALRLQQVNQRRREMGFPPYEPDAIEIRCFSCDLLDKFMVSMLAAKHFHAICRGNRALDVVMSFLRAEVNMHWDNFRKYLFDCVCWSDPPRTIRLGNSWASSPRSLPSSPGETWEDANWCSSQSSRLVFWHKPIFVHLLFWFDVIDCFAVCFGVAFQCAFCMGAICAVNATIVSEKLTNAMMLQRNNFDLSCLSVFQARLCSPLQSIA